MLLKRSNNAAGVGTYNSVPKSDFIDLKAEIDKPDINNLVNITTNLNYLKQRQMIQMLS